MSDTADDPWGKAIANYREVTRWIMSAIAAAFALILGSSPLSNFGSLDPGSARFVLACAGALVAAISLAAAFASAVNVMRNRLMGIEELARDRRLGAVREIVDALLKNRLPPEFRSVETLNERYFESRRRLQEHPDNVAARTGFNLVNGYVAAVIQLAQNREVDILFGRMSNTLKFAVPLTFLGALTFAWAANPAKPNTSTQISNKALLSCSLLSMDLAQTSCIDGVANETSSKVFVAMPTGSIDFVELLEKALDDRVADSARLSTFDVARSLSLRVSDAITDAMGKGFAHKFIDVTGLHSRHSAVQVLLFPPGGSRLVPVKNSDQVEIFPFSSGSDAPPPASKWLPQLSDLVHAAITQTCDVDIAGFADRRGTAQRNLYLSLRRADKVAGIVHDMGLSRNRINIVAQGADDEKFATDGLEDLERNRRVEVRASCANGNANS